MKAPRKISGAAKPTTTKRIRSNDEMLTASVKRSKFADVASTSSAKVAVPRLMSEVVQDYRKVAIIDSMAPRRRMTMDLWMQVEAKLTLMTMQFVMETDDGSKPLPGFDSSEMIRGYRVFKCDDSFSVEFLKTSIAKICDDWEGSKIALIPLNEIPKRPRARIWLSQVKIEPAMLLTCLKRLNRCVPMDDWAVIRQEEPRGQSQSFLLIPRFHQLHRAEKLGCRLRC